MKVKIEGDLERARKQRKANQRQIRNASKTDEQRKIDNEKKRLYNQEYQKKNREKLNQRRSESNRNMSEEKKEEKRKKERERHRDLSPTRKAIVAINNQISYKCKQEGLTEEEKKEQTLNYRKIHANKTSEKRIMDDDMSTGKRTKKLRDMTEEEREEYRVDVAERIPEFEQNLLIKPIIIPIVSGSRTIYRKPIAKADMKKRKVVMKRGQVLEPEIIEKYISLQGIPSSEIFPGKRFTHHSVKITAQPDRLVGKDGCIEAKLVSKPILKVAAVKRTPIIVPATKQNSGAFLYSFSGASGNFKLNRGHANFKQVVKHIMCSGRSYCDYVLYFKDPKNPDNFEMWYEKIGKVEAESAWHKIVEKKIRLLKNPFSLPLPPAFKPNDPAQATTSTASFQLDDITRSLADIDMTSSIIATPSVDPVIPLPVQSSSMPRQQVKRKAVQPTLSFKGGTLSLAKRRKFFSTQQNANSLASNSSARKNRFIDSSSDEDPVCSMDQ